MGNLQGNSDAPSTCTSRKLQTMRTALQDKTTDMNSKQDREKMLRVKKNQIHNSNWLLLTKLLYLETISVEIEWNLRNSEVHR